ncbi:MAG: universal stress protein [Armatimonadetes bacterium]|nr:universal stress protein [Armatimonadota bacterium]
MPHKKILVALNDSPISQEVARIASKLARLDHARLFGVYVFELPRALPLDAKIPEQAERGDKILNLFTSIAAEHGISEVGGEVVQARVAGEGIVDYAKKCEAQLLIVGINDKPRMGDQVLGSAVSDVLKHSPCPVWAIKLNAGV